MTLVRASRRQRSGRQSASICEFPSVCQRHLALADAGLRNKSIRASLAQRLSNQIARNIHVTDRCTFIGIVVRKSDCGMGDDEALIEAVRGFDCLWKVKSKAYKDLRAKENAWKVVAEKV